MLIVVVVVGVQKWSTQKLERIKKDLSGTKHFNMKFRNGTTQHKQGAIFWSIGGIFP